MLEDRDTWVDPIRPHAAMALCEPAKEIDGSHTYLLMDPVFLPGFVEHLKQLVPAGEFRSLYEGRYTGEGIEHIAPYLIHLPQEANQRLQLCSRLIELSRGKPMLNRLCSDGDLSVLTAHFQRQFEAVDEQGQSFLLRLADTRSVSTLMATLTPAQKQRLLAGIRSWWYVDREGEIQTIEGTAAFDLTSTPTPYEIDREQDRQMDALGLPDAILRFIQLRPDRLGTLKVSPSAAHAAIKCAIESIVSAEVIDEAQAHRSALRHLQQQGLLERLDTRAAPLAMSDS